MSRYNEDVTDATMLEVKLTNTEVERGIYFDLDLIFLLFLLSLRIRFFLHLALMLLDSLVEVNQAILAVKLHLGSLNGLVGTGLLSKSLIGVSKLLLNHASSTVRLLQKGACLFKCILVGMGLSVSSNQVVMGKILGTNSVLKLHLDIPEVKLVLLDDLLGISISSISMLKSSLKVHDISLQLLLHSDSLRLALGFRLNSSLHVFETLVHVLSGRLKLLILLSHSSLNFLADLGKLKLSSQNLVLLLFQGTLSLRQSSFKLHLLSLKTLADFVNLMDGATTFADLIHNVLDLIGKSLVLSSHLFKLQNHFLIGRLDSEELRGGIASLLLATIKIHAKAVNLMLPFRNT